LGSVTSGQASNASSPFAFGANASQQQATSAAGSSTGFAFGAAAQQQPQNPAAPASGLFQFGQPAAPAQNPSG